MTEHDFGETYTFLELFFRTYYSREEEVKIVLEAILTTYMQEYGRKDPELVFRCNHFLRYSSRVLAILLAVHEKNGLIQSCLTQRFTARWMPPRYRNLVSLPISYHVHCGTQDNQDKAS